MELYHNVITTCITCTAMMKPSLVESWQIGEGDFILSYLEFVDTLPCDKSSSCDNKIFFTLDATEFTVNIINISTFIIKILYPLRNVADLKIMGILPSKFSSLTLKNFIHSEMMN